MAKKPLPPITPPRNLMKIQSDLKKAAQRIAKAMPIVSRRVVSKTYTVGEPKKDEPKGLSLVELFRKTPQKVKAAMVAGNVSIMRQQRRKTTKGLSYTFMTSTDDKGLSRRHIQTVREKDGADKLYKAKRVVVDCDCGSYMYTFDWANWKAGASDRKRAIDEPPDMTNINHIPGLCKHLSCVALHVAESKL